MKAHSENSKQDSKMNKINIVSLIIKKDDDYNIKFQFKINNGIDMYIFATLNII